MDLWKRDDPHKAVDRSKFTLDLSKDASKDEKKKEQDTSGCATIYFVDQGIVDTIATKAQEGLLSKGGPATALGAVVAQAKGEAEAEAAAALKKAGAKKKTDDVVVQIPSIQSVLGSRVQLYDPCPQSKHHAAQQGGRGLLKFATTNMTFVARDQVAEEQEKKRKQLLQQLTEKMKRVSSFPHSGEHN